MMYSIEFNEMVYWFQSEDHFKKASDSKGNNLLKYSDLAFNNATREIVKCRYDLKEIIGSWMNDVKPLLERIKELEDEVYELESMVCAI